MANFIITFPLKDKMRHDGWVRIINATTPHQVQNYATHAYAEGFAMYYEDDFSHEVGYFPKGCLEEVDFRQWHDFVV